MKIRAAMLLAPDGAGGAGGGGASGSGAVETGQMAFDPAKLQLPDEYKTAPSLANIKTIEDLTKGFVSAQRLVGANRVAVPGNDAGEEAWNNFFKAIGRPDAPELYQLPKIEGLDPSVGLDEAKMKEAKAFMHKIGVTNRQFPQLMKYYLEQTNGTIKAGKQQVEQEKAANIAALKEAWGDKYDANLDIARQVLKKFGDEEVVNFLEDTNLGSNTQLIKLFHAVGLGMLEDVERGGTSGGDLNITDGSRAITEIERLKGDEEFQ